MRAAAALLALLPAVAAAQAPKLTAERVASGFDRPVSLKFDAQGRAFVVEQRGRVRVVEGGKVLPDPFLDLSEKVTKFQGFSEQGLLDVAFHPEFEKNGRFFAHYTDLAGDTVVSEFRVSEDRADPASERVVLTQDQPYSNHNGGQLEFGPDGMLYLALGDGGSGGDPHGNGQKLSTLLGKILRLDVSTAPYRVPADNPFARRKGARGEIWAYGLRNPWRFSFDGSLLYIGDVGQNAWEELDVEDLKDGGGRNYGWSVLEARDCFRAKSCDRAGKVEPVQVHRLYQGGDCSVTGGYVYRGKALPELAGLYLYADYCSGALRSFRYEDGKALDPKDWTPGARKDRPWGQVSSMGRDPWGELYLLSHDTGELLRLVRD